MRELRRYTAQELRDESRMFRYRAAWNPNNAFYVAEKMLQQAADAEEELAKNKKQPRRNCDRFENADDAVEAFDKHCRLTNCDECPCDRQGCTHLEIGNRLALWLFTKVEEGRS